MRTGRERRMSRQRRARAAGRHRTSIIIGIVIAVPIIVAGTLALVFMCGLRVIASVENSLASLEGQRNVTLAQTTEIYAADGTRLAYLHEEQNRTIVSGEDIPDILRYAVVAIEDERFYQHNGVDLEGIFRALVTNIQEEEISQGFSTITMQLMGNLYLNRREMTLTRKFNEMESHFIKVVIH